MLLSGVQHFGSLVLAAVDPFLDLIHLSQPKGTLWGRTEAAGRWALGFHKRDDLLFCWVQRGECLLVRPSEEPVQLRQDDFILIRTLTPFTLTTDPTLEAADSEALVARRGNGESIELGEGRENPVVLRGGRFVFESANEPLLTGLIPPLVHIAAAESVSWRVRSLMSLNEAEFLHPGPGSAFIIVHLIELILVEILRRESLRSGPEQRGLLAGLADPITACALTAMHKDVAHGWTVASLARHCGLSRSAFATRFHHLMGMGPIEYLQCWRMALAKEQLRTGIRGVGEIALAIGFQSSSAFSTAFTRVVGCSPKNFMSRPLDTRSHTLPSTE